MDIKEIKQLKNELIQIKDKLTQGRVSLASLEQEEQLWQARIQQERDERSLKIDQVRRENQELQAKTLQIETKLFNSIDELHFSPLKKIVRPKVSDRINASERKNFESLIPELRKFSNKDLRKKLGVTNGAVFCWYKKKSYPRPKTYQEILKLLNKNNTN